MNASNTEGNIARWEKQGIEQYMQQSGPVWDVQTADVHMRTYRKAPTNTR